MNRIVHQLWHIDIPRSKFRFWSWFQFHSCGWRLALESESDSVKCEKLFLVQWFSLHSESELESVSESGNVNKSLQFSTVRVLQMFTPLLFIIRLPFQCFWTKCIVLVANTVLNNTSMWETTIPKCTVVILVEHVIACYESSSGVGSHCGLVVERFHRRCLYVGRIVQVLLHIVFTLRRLVAVNVCDIRANGVHYNLVNTV